MFPGGLPDVLDGARGGWTGKSDDTRCKAGLV